MKKIKSNDKVKILSGRDRNKEGKVIQVFPNKNLVVVEGVNLRFKHIRKGGQNSGQKVEFFAPINMSNVKLICPKCSKNCRVFIKVLDSNKRVRACKQCNEVID